MTQHRKTNRRRQQYATTASDSTPSEDPSTLQWPTLPDPHRLPTPYQIFNQKQSDPYSKHRFYALVKLYHPDRFPANPTNASSPESQLDPTESLDRYRLIIAANAILSSPQKRHAYDSTGAGWSLYHPSHPSSSAPHYTTQHRWHDSTASQHPYQDTADDCMYNATWEDWEEWYARQSARARGHPPPKPRSRWWPGGGAAFFTPGDPQAPVYASNHVFLSVVATLALLGGVAQATRANERAKGRTARLAERSEENAALLMRAREESRRAREEGEGRGERIRRWYREREGVEEGEPDGRMQGMEDMGRGSFCGSEKMSDRGEVPFWKRPTEEWER